MPTFTCVYGALQATYHRVLLGTTERMSIPFFFEPVPEFILDPKILVPDEEPKYEAVTYREHITNTNKTFKEYQQQTTEHLPLKPATAASPHDNSNLTMDILLQVLLGHALFQYTADWYVCEFFATIMSTCTRHQLNECTISRERRPDMSIRLTIELCH